MAIVSKTPVMMAKIELQLNLFGLFCSTRMFSLGGGGVVSDDGSSTVGAVAFLWAGIVPTLATIVSADIDFLDDDSSGFLPKMLLGTS
uniref:AlNc14C143G7314 protein n=1 Tax=Albugo laibachii Nc14 TaxID=890382 RepID=F0WLC6_9STRA|nr:AlNc14C143G7314 [Albugo laibachii Nc14]|eukprot:CCA22089.1 AlNc14C143G7314 [Albugo laibachii Nc14]